MQSHPLRHLAAVAFDAAVTACASKPVSTEKPVIRKIAVVAATEPPRLTLENQNAVVFLSPITSLGFQEDSKWKANLFNEKMAPQKPSMPPRLAGRPGSRAQQGLPRRFLQE